MTDATAREPIAAIQAVFARARDRMQSLVVLVARPRSPEVDAVLEQFGWPRVHVGQALTQRLLEVPRARHPLAVEPILRDLVAQHLTASAVFLDRLEVLFLPALKIDPVGLLCRLAHERPLLVRWPGSWTGTDLVYAEPGHPEYRVFPRPRVEVVDLRAYVHIESDHEIR